MSIFRRLRTHEALAMEGEFALQKQPRSSARESG